MILSFKNELFLAIKSPAKDISLLLRSSLFVTSPLFFEETLILYAIEYFNCLEETPFLFPESFTVAGTFSSSISNNLDLITLIASLQFEID